VEVQPSRSGSELHVHDGPCRRESCLLLVSVETPPRSDPTQFHLMMMGLTHSPDSADCVSVYAVQQ
jgi:hypothetical protein